MDDRRRTALVPVALLAALALASCGGGDESEPADLPGVGAVRAGSVAQLSSCADWRAGSVEERFATIEQVRSQVAPEGGGEAPSLPDDEAYEFFEASCAPDYAASFRLYKLYNRGASFRPLTD